VRQAVLAAGYAGKSVSQVLNYTLENKRVRPALAHALRIAGVTDQLKADVLAGALGASKEYTTKDGDILTGGPDHGNRLKALKIALLLDGDLGGVQVEGEETIESRIESAGVAGYNSE
jgi:hypothetical protein